jgi:adenine-specific DNA-methyltransferase
MAEKLEMASSNIINENIEYIATKFPNVLKEVMENGKLVKKIDFDVLKQELSTLVMDDKQERYQMTWPDKKKSILLANSRINATLRPVKEKSVDFDNTQNLYIEGDNLDVLKLLRETYLGKIKMIYIDPPYNTGNDFVYEDDFSQSSEEYLARSGQFDEQSNRLFQNNDSNGRFHTDWLNMMYPRLKLAKDLLSDDGVIFISIDHNEVINLTKICDEIFSSSNRIALLSVINNLKGRSDDKFFATCNEFALVYSKNKSSFKLGGFKLDDEELDNDYDKQDEIGYYKLIGFRKTGNAWKREDRPYMFYPVLYKDGIFSTISNEERLKIFDDKKGFDDDFVSNITIKYSNLGYVVKWPKAEDGSLGRWRWGIQSFMEQKDYNLEFNNSGTICTKMRATLEDGSIRIKSAKTLWYKPEYDTGSSSRVLKSLFGIDSLFDNPKSLIYMTDIIKICTSSNDIILDFFSGSGTIAHAVIHQNSIDNLNRSFILVQLPEVMHEKSTGYKEGYSTICDLAEERIRRAGEKFNKKSTVLGKNLDAGFRVLKLDSSNMNEVYYNPNRLNQDMLDQLVGNIKEDRTPLDLLFQVMLELGIELSAKIQEEELFGKKYFVVNESDLVACFDDGINDEFVKEIAKIHSIYAVFKDSAFTNDSSNINCEQIFKSISPSTTIKVV